MRRLFPSVLAPSIALALASAPLAPPAFGAEPTTDPAGKFAALAAEAEQAYEAKNYQGAIAKYLDAFAVIESPDVLYNVAVIYEDNLGKPDMAKNFYERILRNPSSRPELVKLATERLADIDKKAAQDAARPTLIRRDNNGNGNGNANGNGNTNTLIGSNATPSEGPGPAPWILVATGGALMIVGAIEGVSALGDASDQDALELDEPEDLAKSRDLADSADTEAALSDAFLFGGGALVIGGLIWWAVADKGPSAPAHGSVFFEPRLGPGSIASEVGVRF